MNHLIVLTALLLNIAACDAGTAPQPLQPPPHQAGKSQCTSTPCGNTASGKDPQEERTEAGKRIQDARRASDDDRKRWSIPIYSTSSSPEDLSLEVVRRAKMAIRLWPAKGHLAISTPASTHVFAIASPQGSRNVCPIYNLYVVEASNEHILLKRVCPTFEYKPGRYARSITYYLYDNPTGTMRDIWRASSSGKDAPFPEANPRPTLKRITNGYQFDWSGIYPDGTGGQLHEIHNRFTRKLDGGEPTLICTNVSPGPGHGDPSACEGEYLERVGG